MRDRDLLIITAMTFIIGGCQFETPVVLLGASQESAAETQHLTDDSSNRVERRCGISVDQTASVDREARSAVVKELIDSLPRLVDDLRCTSVSVSAFSDEGPFSRVDHFDTPDFRHLLCAAVAATPSGRAMEHFPGYQEMIDDRCAGQRAKEDEQNARGRQAVIDEVAKALLAIEPVEGGSTDLVAHLRLLNAISKPNDIDIIVSDLSQTAPTTGPVKPNHDVRFILLPISEGTHWDVSARALDNLENLTQLFPGSSYVLPAKLGTGRWWEGYRR